MIIRIVKMTFIESEILHFLDLFEQSKIQIRNMPGCSHLELLRDVNQPSVFFTYSIWNSENDLNNYRKSTLFNNVWAQTKIKFAQKPEAWSLQRF
jgi:heme-degrading monooxygenase HmoA